jgi:3-oxoadipate enol-lactonase
LHGIGGAARAWRGQLETFGDQYHAIAWDMPGYGGSAPSLPASIATLADAFQDFLEEIGATTPIVVGHSIGGMIVQQWLVKHPQAATAVVLAQTSPAFGKADGDWSYRASMLALLGFDQRKALADIKIPTLVLSGSKDKNAPAPMMAKMATYIPSASYVELEGVGHLANLEHPKAFNAALDQFLRSRVTSSKEAIA